MEQELIPIAGYAPQGRSVLVLEQVLRRVLSALRGNPLRLAGGLGALV